MTVAELCEKVISVIKVESNVDAAHGTAQLKRGIHRDKKDADGKQENEEQKDQSSEDSLDSSDEESRPASRQFNVRP